MSTRTENKFSCVIIGNTSLPIRCAEVLLSSGHSIAAIVSDDDKVKKWATGHKIKLHRSIADLLVEKPESIDYVFSIVNEHILRDEILTLPSKGTINYHDGPLPKYAGTHATSWAILNHEKSHGITWHYVTDVVDAGDILKQARINIADDETAHSLNTKCFEAAIREFGELVVELSTETCQPTKQDLAQRTFFPRFKRPVNGGVVSWNSPSKEISALVRALNFGPHPNPLGTAKVAIDDSFLIVSDVAIADFDAESAPGTINEIGSDFIRVSSGDKEIILRRFLQLDGRSLTVSDLQLQCDLKIGSRLQDLTPEQYLQIETNIGRTSRSERYWVKKLSGVTPAAAPFADTIVSPAAAKYETLPFTLPEEFVDVVKLSAGAHSVGLNVLIAFAGFLSRLTDLEHFDVGFHDTAIQEQFAEPEGLFVRWVPLRLNIDRQKSFLSQLGTIASEIETTRAHTTFCSDITARYSQIPRSVGGGALATLPANILVGNQDARPTGDLTLALRDAESTCCLTFDVTKFGKDGVAKFLKYFTNFLAAIAHQPDAPLGELALLSEDERKLLLNDLNNSCVEVPADKCIHHLFEAQVDRTPNDVALIAGDRRITYRELDQLSELVACQLRDLGVGPDVLVAVCVTRSVEMIAGILGILKAGGAYVPLDPAYPQARLDQILEDSGARVLISEPTSADKLNTRGISIVHFDASDKPAEITRRGSSAKQTDLAYVIYTSGSTGKPKGVAIEHRSAVAFLTWATSVFTVEQLEGTVASTSICFDLSIFEIFAPLSCGGTVILVENILQLPFAPAAGNATLINTVPSAITELLRMKGVPESVETVNLAGEPLKTSLVNQIYRTTNVRKVFDLYGPTEDTTYSTYTLRKDGKATIGRPIANTQAYILDRNLQLVPPGIPGELYLGGDGLAREYLNRPDLTASRFIKDPFDPESSRRLYRTGDLVRYLPSFEIEYLGRIDNQVKIRGFRIELGEIEAVLTSHAGVEGAVVVADEHPSNGKRLVAYFVASVGEKIAAPELREYLKSSLPDFMVPSTFVELDDFPLTPNGKIDRKALPAPSHSVAEPNRSYVAARTEVESELVRIWERLLQVSPVGIRDDFFELGGDSLVSVSLFVEIENQFGCGLPLSALVNSPTIEKLAEQLESKSSTADWKYLVPLQAEGERTPLFCMHAAGGNVLFYRDLANELGKDQPFYGLQARGVADKSETAHDRVEDMARDYLREIRSFQPSGPYNLCGSSFGGLVAFEAARQLVAMGEKVGMLALFDTYAPGNFVANVGEVKVHRLKGLVFRIKNIGDQLRQIEGWRKRLEFVRAKAAKVNKKFKRKVAWTKNQFAIEYNKATGRELPQDMMRNHAAIRKAMDNYLPEKLEGNMVLFRASEQPTASFDPHLGWDPFVSGEVEAVVVKGTHGALTVYPFAADLAVKLAPFLNERIVSTQALPPQVSHKHAPSTVGVTA